MNEKLYVRIKRRRAIVLDAFERALDALESDGDGIDMVPYVKKQLAIARESVVMSIDLVDQKAQEVMHG